MFGLARGMASWHGLVRDDILSTGTRRRTVLAEKQLTGRMASIDNFSILPHDVLQPAQLY